MSEYSLHPTLLLFPSIAADSSSLVCKQIYKRISAFDGLESTSPTCIMLLKIKCQIFITTFSFYYFTVKKG